MLSFFRLIDFNSILHGSESTRNVFIPSFLYSFILSNFPSLDILKDILVLMGFQYMDDNFQYNVRNCSFTKLQNVSTTWVQVLLTLNHKTIDLWKGEIWFRVPFRFISSLLVFNIEDLRQFWYCGSNFLFACSSLQIVSMLAVHWNKWKYSSLNWQCLGNSFLPSSLSFFLSTIEVKKSDTVSYSLHIDL